MRKLANVYLLDEVYSGDAEENDIISTVELPESYVIANNKVKEYRYKIHHFHLYFTLKDLKINKGDWCIIKNNKTIYLSKAGYTSDLSICEKYGEKIVATTNTKISKCGKKCEQKNLTLSLKSEKCFYPNCEIPLISLKFKEEFCEKNGEIKNVFLEYEESIKVDIKTNKIKTNEDKTVITHRAKSYDFYSVIDISKKAMKKFSNLTEKEFEKEFENFIKEHIY